MDFAQIIAAQYRHEASLLYDRQHPLHRIELPPLWRAIRCAVRLLSRVAAPRRGVGNNVVAE